LGAEVVLEAFEVEDLGAQPDRGERVDPAQAPQPGDVPGTSSWIVFSILSRRMISGSIAPR
jgi:hypothetical protein